MPLLAYIFVKRNIHKKGRGFQHLCYMYVCMYVCMHVCMYIHIPNYVHMYLRVHLHRRVQVVEHEIIEEVESRNLIL